MLARVTLAIARVGRFRHAPQDAAVAAQARDRRGQRRDIPRGHDDAGLAVGHRFGNGGVVRRDDGASRRHGLDDGIGLSFERVIGREHVDIGPDQQRDVGASVSYDAPFQRDVLSSSADLGIVYWHDGRIGVRVSLGSAYEEATPTFLSEDRITGRIGLGMVSRF